MLSARARGPRVTLTAGGPLGLTVQLFDKASLQQAFTLVDGARPDDETVMRERLALLTGGLGLDNLNLSFGEFFGADPRVLIDRIDATYRQLQEVSPGTRMSAVIHVGDTPELRVEYGGRQQLYYFLVRYANPAIFPRVHTVMFYELVDGVEITAARARFTWAVFASAQAFNTGHSPDAALEVAKAQLVRGQRAAGRRRLAFHAPNGQQLISDGANPSFYDYGYLRDANTLCFWRRELAQVRNLVEQAGVAVPGCVL